MTVAVDVITESVRTATTDPWTFSHAGGASPNGVILLINHGTESTDLVTGTVSYGGVAMARVLSNADTLGEASRTYAYFLGSGVPTGTQTVSADLASATGTDIAFYCITIDAADNTQVVDSDGVGGDTANPSVVLSAGGRTCMAFGTFKSGLPNVTDITSNANMTRLHDHDYGINVAVVDRQTTASTSDFTFSYTSATDDVAMTVITVSEVVAGGAVGHVSVSIIGF